MENTNIYCMLTSDGCKTVCDRHTIVERTAVCTCMQYQSLSIRYSALLRCPIGFTSYEANTIVQCCAVDSQTMNTGFWCGGSENCVRTIPHSGSIHTH